MSEKSDKEKIVTRLVTAAICSSAPLKPGTVIKQMSESERKIVKELKSEDFNRRVK
jgi:hypothetical protein